MKHKAIFPFIVGFLFGIFLAQPAGAAAIRSARPRLMLTPEKLSTLRARATANTPQWQRMKAKIDPLLTANPSSGSLLICPALALAYQVTGNPAYGRRAIELAVTGTVSLGTSWQGTNQFRGLVQNVALCYDWAYDQMDATQKNILLTMLSQSNEHHLTTSVPLARNSAGNNNYVGPVRTVAWNAIAIFGDYPAAQSNFDAARDVFVTNLVPFINTASRGGSITPEGSEYAPQTTTYYAEIMEAALSGTGEDLYPLVPNFQDELLQFMLHSTSPTGRSVTSSPFSFNAHEPMPYGDQEVNFQERFSYTMRIMMLELAEYFQRVGSSQNAAFTQFWLTEIQPAFFNNNFSDIWPWFYDFFHLNPNAPSADWRFSYPLDYHATGGGKTRSRSDWGPNATWVGFDCGIQKNLHTHGDCNQFLIWRKGRWLTRDVLGWEGPYPGTELHNTLLINGVGSSIFQGTMRGHGVINRRETAADNSYTYTQGDATQTYQIRTNPVTLFLRDFLYLKPDLFVFADRVTYSAPAPTIWQIQALREFPTISGNRIAITNTATNRTGPHQVLYTTSVTPASPQFVVGDLGSISSQLAGNYRVTHTSGQAQLSEQFLFVLQAGDLGETPIEVGRIAGSGFHAAQFLNYIVAAPTSPGSPGTISFSYAPAFNTTRHMYMGMNLSGAYQVTCGVDASDKRTITISAGGSGGLSGGRCTSGLPLSVSATSAGMLIFDADDSALPKVPIGANVMSRVSGDQQTGAVGSALPIPLTVKVLDPTGAPQPGVNVSFVVTSTGATVSLSASQATTDGSGIAAVTATIGSRTGPIQVQAINSTVAGSPITFDLTAVPGPPTSFSRLSGDNQSGVVQSALLNPLVVKITDAFNNGIVNQTVNFTVTAGGGTLSRTSAVTDVNGQASVNYTLGPSPGSNSVTASAPGVSAPSLVFTASAVGGAAAALAQVSGNNQTGVVSTPLALPLVVRVTDAGGNPVSGVSVTWSVTSGNISFSTPALLTTSPNGEAQVSVLLGPTAGPATVRASAGGVGATVSFNVSSVAAVAANFASVSGNNQSGRVGTALTAPFVVRASDSSGNAVPGLSVTFLVLSGGGSITPATPVLTDSTGTARGTLTLPATPGAVRVIASAAGIATTVEFNATANTGPAAKLVLVSGNGQTAPVGQALPVPLVVAVQDSLNNPVSGTTVNFAVTSGGGTLSASSAITGANGQASVTLTLGPNAGANIVTASSGTLTGSPVTFTETGAPAGAGSIRLVSGDGQGGPVGTALTSPLVVQVLSSTGQPVPGLPVTFAVFAGGGSIATAQPVISDAQGNASARLTLGPAPGVNTVLVTTAGVGNAITFTAIASSGSANRLVVFGGNNQSGIQGTPLAQPLVVKVTDTFNNPLAGAAVSFRVNSGGGTLSSPSATTNSLGLASVSFTLPTIPGLVDITASAGSVSSLTATFLATALGTTSTVGIMQVVGGEPQTAVVGSPLQPLAVRVLNAQGVPQAGVSVPFALDIGSVEQLPQTQVTDASGIARATVLLGTTPGESVVTAALPGYANSPAVFHLTTTPGPPVKLVKVSGDEQTGFVQSALGSPLVLRVTDIYDNPIRDVTITGRVFAGSAILSPASAVSDVRGEVRFLLVGGADPGQVQVIFRLQNQLDPSATFTARLTGTEGVVISAVSGDGQSAVVGAALPQPLVVSLVDAASRPIVGLRVDFSGATFSPTFGTTDAAGRVSVGVTLGRTAGPVALAVTVSALRLTKVFSATALPGPAGLITVISGDNQAGAGGQALPQPIVVRVTDAFGNPVQAIVLFQASASQGTFSPARISTDGRGQASTSFTLLPGVLGQVSLRAVIEGTTAFAEINVNGQAIPFITGIVNPASFTDPNPANPQLASNSLFTIFGTELADFPETATGLPLPTRLGGTSVLLGGTVVPLLFVSPTQINGFAPSSLESSPTVEVTVVRNGISSSRTFYRLVGATPGLFTQNQSASGPVVALHGVDFSLVTPLNPARRGETIFFYATGLGNVTNPPASGAPASSNPLSVTVNTPIVVIGGVQVPVSFAGLAPNYVGLFQVNIQITDQVPTGLAQSITLTIGGQTSNTATIAIREQ